MASDTLNNFNFTFSMRNAPSNGPTSSDAWNDSFTELATDLANISLEWNNKIVVIIGGLPYGNQDLSIDAFTNGLDGKNMWVDQDVTSASADLTYYDATNDRPVTVEEALTDLYQYVDSQITTWSDTLIEQTSALTTAQKNAIGINIFDSTQASSAASLDGKSENNRLNALQIAQDLYGGTYSLDNDGTANLSNSVMAMVDALLELHNGNWDNDITLSHTGVSALQVNINASSPGNDSYAGSPVNLEDDLNEIRTEVKTLKGTGAWTSALTPLYAGGADSLEDLLVSTAGSGVKSATNPWGYHYDNIDGLSLSLSTVYTYTGMTSAVDATPTYSSTTTVANGDSLETAIGKLDVITGAALLADGTRPMTGNLSMGGLSINHVANLGVGQNVTVSGNIAAGGTISGLDLHVANDATVSGEMRVETAVEVGQDIEITGSPAYGLILTSPNGTRWRIKVDDSGIPSGVAI